MMMMTLPTLLRGKMEIATAQARQCGPWLFSENATSQNYRIKLFEIEKELYVTVKVILRL